jgi:hypothetical protein
MALYVLNKITYLFIWRVYCTKTYLGHPQTTFCGGSAERLQQERVEHCERERERDRERAPGGPRFVHLLLIVKK